MKKTGLKIVAAVAVVGLVGWGVCHFCCGPKIGVIDFARVQKEASVYKLVMDNQAKYEENVRVSLNVDAGKLAQEKQDLDKQQSKLGNAEYQKRLTALQVRAQSVQQQYQVLLNQILMASQTALKTAENEIAQSIEATAESVGVDVIVPVTSTLYFRKKADVTGEFVQQLDQRIKTVEYPNPAQFGAQGQQPAAEQDGGQK